MYLDYFKNAVNALTYSILTINLQGKCSYLFCLIPGDNQAQRREYFLKVT